MKRVVTLFLGIAMLTLCVSCKSQEADMTPEIKQMKSICELAVMDCYYHNVAKYEEKDASGILLWKRDKKFWVEYDGIVKLGIDTSLVSMELDDDTVTITIPNAEVLDCVVDSSSLTKDSFYLDAKSAKIEAADESAAFAEAQQKMREAAESNRTLLNSAQERAQMLLESYVKNIGDAIGKEYSVQWKFVESDKADAPAAEPAAEA